MGTSTSSVGVVENMHCRIYLHYGCCRRMPGVNTVLIAVLLFDLGVGRKEQQQVVCPINGLSITNEDLR